jgi:molecular chaperone HtpG
MTDPNVEKREFRSELRQVLHLITHSLYSKREIFLRELISNASDAIDKVRFNSLDQGHLVEGDSDWKIRLVADKGAGTLTVTDNGLGMSRETIIEDLGTIARSGTRAFLERLQQAEGTVRPELIGQFGVGFYSAFMVADRVTVRSRAAGQPPSTGVAWESDGQGEFTVETVEVGARGTEVTLHLKEDAREFLEEWRLRGLVKQFSDFIEHPVVMAVPGVDGSGPREETFNSRKALWLRSKADVTPEDHQAFYHQVSGDFEAPARTIHFTGEGSLEFRALLYIPRHRSMDLQFGDAKAGPRLYIDRVLIMETCETLLPAYLRFVKGVVDCPDLPLNVSRETLQHNPQMEKIQKVLVKAVLRNLEEMGREEPEAYQALFGELGSILKEGLSRDFSHREQIADLLRFDSLKGAPTSLAQYVEALPEDQKAIYYLTGESRTTLEHAPALEVFRRRGWDVLLLSDPIDEFVFPSLPEYKGKQLLAADRAELDLPAEEAARAEEAAGRFQPLLERLRTLLGMEVRLSRRLTDSAACLVAEEGGMGANLERLMARLGRKEGLEPARRVLELNPDHPVVGGLLALCERNPEDPRLEAYGHLLHEGAMLSEGSRLSDPTAFIRRVNELVAREIS